MMNRALSRMVGAACLLAALFATAYASAGPRPRPATQDAYAAFCVGIELMQAKRYTEAVHWLEQAVEFDPKSAASHTWIGVICDQKLHTPRKSRQHFERALKLSPDSFVARYGIARLYFGAGQHEKAAEEMLAAIRTTEAKHNPALAARAYTSLAVNFEQRGDRRKAVEYYTKAAEVAPSPVYALVRLGRFYRAVGENEKAIRVFLKVKRLVPTYGRVHQQLCDAYKATGRWKQALQELQAYISHRNGPGQRSALLKEAAALAEKCGDTETAQKLHQTRLLKLVKYYTPQTATPRLCEDIASELESLGRLEQAEPYLRDAAENAAGHTEARLRMKLASLYQKLGMTDKAVQQLNRCIRQLEPETSIRYRTKLCAVLEEAGKYPEAENALRQILDIPGSKAIGHAELGLFHSRRDDTGKAVKHLHRAIKLADTDQSARYRIQLSIVYTDAGRHKEAEQVLIEAQKIFPDNPSVNNALGWFYAQRGLNLDKALGLIQKALEKHPRNPYYLDSLGWVYFKQGCKKKALKQLLKAAALGQDSAILDHLGDVYMALGQPEKAGTQWKRSLELDPDASGVRRKLESLNKAP